MKSICLFFALTVLLSSCTVKRQDCVVYYEGVRLPLDKFKLVVRPFNNYDSNANKITVKGRIAYIEAEGKDVFANAEVMVTDISGKQKGGYQGASLNHNAEYQFQIPKNTIGQDTIFHLRFFYIGTESLIVKNIPYNNQTIDVDVLRAK